ncbi:MAG: sulfotransferase family protein [Ilumatobacteraceae bacterium]
MGIQLIGAGLGRTGTMSLKLALEELLGGTCHHMAEVFGHQDELPAWEAAMRGEPVDWRDVLSGYTAIVDYPGAAVWRELAEAFPDAPVLLSTRSSAQTWWESASATILQSHEWEPPDEAGRAQQRMIAAMFAQNLGDDLSDADAMMASYERHNAEVRATVAPERLFEYQPGDGWAPLCTALGLDVPDTPFPHTNTRDEFLARTKDAAD